MNLSQQRGRRRNVLTPRQYTVDNASLICWLLGSHIRTPGLVEIELINLVYLGTSASVDIASIVIDPVATGIYLVDVATGVRYAPSIILTDPLPSIVVGFAVPGSGSVDVRMVIPVGDHSVADPSGVPLAPGHVIATVV